MGVVKEHSITIDGIYYTTKTLPAIQGLVVMPRLVNLVGYKTLALIFGAYQEAGSEGATALFSDMTVTAAVIANIAKNLAEKRPGDPDPTDVLKDALIDTTADKVDFGAGPVQGSVYEHFDEHFGANYMHLLKVVGWVGAVNFIGPSFAKSLFDGVGAEAKATTAA